MKIPSKTISLLATAALFTLSSLSAVETDPVGYVTITIDGDNKYNFISIPLVGSVVASGQATSAGATSIDVSGAQWAVDEFAGSYVEITSAGEGSNGGGEGLMLDILSNTSTQLVLADDISSYSLEGSETFVIRNHETLSTIFGASNSAGFLGGATAGASDEIKLWNPSIQGFDSYFYSTAFSRWAPSADPFNGDASDEVLYPDHGVVILRKDTGTKDIVVAGSVKLNASKVNVYPGLNFYDNMKPTDVALGATGWESDLTGGATGGAADEIGIWDSSTQLVTYYFFSTAFSRWAPSSDPFNGDASSVIISAGDSVLINRKSAGVVLDESALVIN